MLSFLNSNKWLNCEKEALFFYVLFFFSLAPKSVCAKTWSQISWVQIKLTSAGGCHCRNPVIRSIVCLVPFRFPDSVEINQQKKETKIFLFLKSFFFLLLHMLSMQNSLHAESVNHLLTGRITVPWSPSSMYIKTAQSLSIHKHYSVYT